MPVVLVGDDHEYRGDVLSRGWHRRRHRRSGNGQPDHEYEGAPPARVRIDLPKGRYLPQFTFLDASRRQPLRADTSLLVPPFKSLSAPADDAGFSEGYGVVVDHYAPVGSALIWMFKATLGDRFTPEMEDAWIETYAAISSDMERGARG